MREHSTITFLLSITIILACGIVSAHAISTNEINELESQIALTSHSIGTGTPQINAGANLAQNQYQSDLRTHPTDDNQYAITSKLGYEEQDTAAYVTSDDGATWNIFSQDQSSDPDIIYDDQGIIHWSFIDKTSGSRMGYRQSSDEGATWSERKIIGPSTDHPHIIFDQSPTSPYYGSIYVAGRSKVSNHINVMISQDRGVTWTLKQFDTSNTITKGFVYGMSITEDGTLIIPTTSKNNILLTPQGQYGGSIRDIYVWKSTDGANTLTPIHITEKTSPLRKGVGGFFALSNAAINPITGRIFFAWAQDFPEPQPTQIFFTYSDDKGQTWSQPQQGPGLPPNIGAGSMSILTGEHGIIGMQYYGFTQQAFDIYFAASEDDGANWSEPIRITAHSSKEFSNQPRWPGQDQVYADTKANGNFQLVWTDSRDDDQSYKIYTQTLQINEINIDQEESFTIGNEWSITPLPQGNPQVILPQNIIVRDEKGNLHFPELNITQIVELNPAKAYWARTTTNNTNVSSIITQTNRILEQGWNLVSLPPIIDANNTIPQDIIIRNDNRTIWQNGTPRNDFEGFATNKGYNIYTPNTQTIRLN